MRKFNYRELANKTWDTDILNLVARIHECKGRQDLFIRQKPVELSRLAAIAKIQSVESSNKIEGIVTTNTRIKQLLSEKTTPRNRDEEEIVGYRDVLNEIHENNGYIPLNASHILKFHHNLLRRTGVSYCGKFKTIQNYIVETKPDGSQTVRFTPVSPYETPKAIEAICAAYEQAVADESIDPLIVIPTFIVDFLCIHPFSDGNGRISRLLSLLLLYKHGYIVGKYISIEQQIEKTKDIYYHVLARADAGWHEEANDPTLFIKYMLEVILACYTDFEDRVGLLTQDSQVSTAYDIVKRYTEEVIGRFTSADVISHCPSIGRSSALYALKKFIEEGAIVKYGNGRNTFYVRSDSIQ